jgi:hypothetical protein
MVKEWANKDKYHPSDGVLGPRVQLPRAKVSVRSVRAWGEWKAVGGATAQATSVRPVQAWTGSSLGFVLVQVRGLILEFVILVVGLESLQEVSLLGTLPLELTTGMGGVLALRRREGIVHGFSFVVLVLLQVERFGHLMVVTVVVFVEVSLVGKMVWFVLTPLSSKWLGTGFTLLELTPVLSCLLALALGFELQVDVPENIWLISGVVLWLHIPVVTCRCITFGDGGQG